MLSLDDDDYALLGWGESKWHAQADAVFEKVYDRRIARVPSRDELEKRANTRRANKQRRREKLYGNQSHGHSL